MGYMDRNGMPIPQPKAKTDSEEMTEIGRREIRRNDRSMGITPTKRGDYPLLNQDPKRRGK